MRMNACMYEYVSICMIMNLCLCENVLITKVSEYFSLLRLTTFFSNYIHFQQTFMYMYLLFLLSNVHINYQLASDQSC